MMTRILIRLDENMRIKHATFPEDARLFGLSTLVGRHPGFKLECLIIAFVYCNVRDYELKIKVTGNINLKPEQESSKVIEVRGA
jgi:hypothetical protein